MNESVYITTAIPYVNAAPHLGFATELVLTDALARYHRQRGKTVRFCTGTDDNSLKNARAAEAEGVAPAELVARNAQRFEDLHGPLGLGPDDFIRTSVDPRHRPGVDKLWRACVAAGDVYRKTYCGLYCVGCEQFYSEDDLDGGVCPEHRSPLERVEEDNYFFRLSRYQDRLHALLSSGELRVQPEHHRAALLRFIEGGLEDLSISRSKARARGWGLPVPGDPEQVIYVWFDALANYINALGYADPGPTFARFWDHAAARVHVVGKGVTRFHGVYWPAILLSAGVRLPTDLLVHAYVTVDGQKIGKSLGNTVDPVALAETYGADALRYFLLRHIRTHEDGDFSEARLRQAIDAELAAQLGNLVRRTTTLVERFANGTVAPTARSVREPGQGRCHGRPAERPRSGPDTEASIHAVGRGSGRSHLEATVRDAVDSFRPHRALDAIFEEVAALNRFVADEAPWVLAKSEAPEDKRRLSVVLYELVESLRQVGFLLQPFLPNTGEALTAQLGFAPARTWEEGTTWGAGQRIGPVRTGRVLFERQAARRDSSSRASAI